MNYVMTPNPKILWDCAEQTIIIDTSVNIVTHEIFGDFVNYDSEAASRYMSYLWEDNVQVGVPALIRSKKHRDKQYILCPIAHDFYDAPMLGALEACLSTIRSNAFAWNVTSIATHPMGCGPSASLSWEVVHAMLAFYMGDAPISVTIYNASPPVPAKIEVDEDDAPYLFAMPIPVRAKAGERR